MVDDRSFDHKTAAAAKLNTALARAQRLAPAPGGRGGGRTQAAPALPPKAAGRLALGGAWGRGRGKFPGPLPSRRPGRATVLPTVACSAHAVLTFVHAACRDAGTE